MLRPRQFFVALTAAFALAGGASCTAERATAPQATQRSSLLGISLWASPRLITCPAGTPQTVTGLIGPLGGVLAAGNTQVLIPANAVLAPTNFTLSVPSSKYVEIEVTAEGAEHYLFAQPVIVTIDYGRCGRSNIDRGLLSAWNIDPDTKELLEQMPSVDDKLTRTVTFTTIHFSGYAVAD